MNDSTSTLLPDWPTRWPKGSFKGAGTWVLAIVLASIFIATFVGTLRSSGAPVRVNPLVLDIAFLLQFVVEGVLVVVVLLALPHVSKLRLTELGFRMPGGATLVVAVFGALAMAIVANGTANLIDHFAHNRHEQDIVEIFRALHDRTAIVIFAAFAIVFAPFAEETFFRVFFFNLGLRYGGFWTGAVVSGALFGLAHGDLYAAVPLALGGVILCYVYVRTRNAYAPMISHALFNALSIAALLFAPSLTR